MMMMMMILTKTYFPVHITHFFPKISCGLHFSATKNFMANCSIRPKIIESKKKGIR